MVRKIVKLIQEDHTELLTKQDFENFGFPFDVLSISPSYLEIKGINKIG
jgi:hypothetical protein